MKKLQKIKTNVVYLSKLGNIDKFVKKLNTSNVIKIEENLVVRRPYFLVIATWNFGEVQIEVKKFLSNKTNAKNLMGVAGSGNTNWGRNFAIAADKVSQKFNVPILHKFNLQGNIYDVESFTERCVQIENDKK